MRAKRAGQSSDMDEAESRAAVEYDLALRTVQFQGGVLRETRGGWDDDLAVLVSARLLLNQAQSSTIGTHLMKFYYERRDRKT